MAFEGIKQAIRDLKSNPTPNEVKFQSESLLASIRTRAKELKNRWGGNSREMTASSITAAFQKVRDRLPSKGMAISGLAAVSVLLLTQALKSVEPVRKEYAETQSYNQQAFMDDHPDSTLATVSFLPTGADVKSAPRNY